MFGYFVPILPTSCMLREVVIGPTTVTKLKRIRWPFTSQALAEILAGLPDLDRVGVLCYSLSQSRNVLPNENNLCKIIGKMRKCFRFTTFAALTSEIGRFSNEIVGKRHRTIPEDEFTRFPTPLGSSFTVVRHGLTNGGSLAPLYSVSNRFIRYQRYLHRHPNITILSPPYGHWCNETEIKMPKDEVCVCSAAGFGEAALLSEQYYLLIHLYIMQCLHGRTLRHHLTVGPRRFSGFISCLACTVLKLYLFFSDCRL